MPLEGSRLGGIVSKTGDVFDWNSWQENTELENLLSESYSPESDAGWPGGNPRQQPEYFAKYKPLGFEKNEQFY